MTKLITFLILISLTTLNATAEDKYPLYAEKSTEDTKLKDPIYRHKQLMEQLIRIECAIHKKHIASSPHKARRSVCKVSANKTKYIYQ